jgi:putative intracellular protease/amidase
MTRYRWRTIARGVEGVRDSRGEIVASICHGNGTVDYGQRKFVTKAAAVAAAEDDLDAMVAAGREIR